MPRIRNYRLLAATAFVLCIGATSAGPASAEGDSFYDGKRITIAVGSSAGGGYDTYARLLSRHMGRYIPGEPSFLVQNMPGAGGLKVVDFLYNVAPRGGTYIGAVQRGSLFEPLLGASSIDYDVNRFGWLGSMNSETGVVVATNESPVKTAEDLFEKKFIVGGTGPASDTNTIPLAYNALLGTRFELITGYPGMDDVVIAAERGELHGAGDWSWSNVKVKAKKEVADGELILLMQSGLKKHPDLPDVPLVFDFVKDTETRQVLELLLARKTLGRPFLVTPETPTDRLEMLQVAFMSAMNDEAFRADAKKMRRELDPVSGEEIAATLKRIYSAPKGIVEKAKEAIAPSGT